MVNQVRMDAEEEALFRSYPYALYFVHSPSTVSQSNTADLRVTTELSAFHSPLRPENVSTKPTQEAIRFNLSRYSSSHGSNNSFLHEKKIVYDGQIHGTEGTEQSGDNRLIGIDDDDDLNGDGDDEYEYEEEDEDFGRELGWWGGWGWRYYWSFGASSSLVWIGMQIFWRVLLSLGIALVVFYIATKPPPPNMSVKIAGIREFVLGEGVDASGVTTKVLTCNCSINLLVENKSKLFVLHLHPPFIKMSFANLPLAISYGPKLYAESDGSTIFQLFVATRNKPMYGAGRAMQDMLDMRQGLPLAIHLSFRSSFRVVWGLIKPKFHHKADCFLVLNRGYDKKHHTQSYKSSCIITT